MPETTAPDITALENENLSLMQRLEDAEKERASLNARLAALNLTPALAVGPPVIANPTAVDLDTFTNGDFKDCNTGEAFKLKIVPENEANFKRTHVLKNKEHFVEMTEDAFRLRFDKA